MATTKIKNAANVDIDIELPNPNGRAAAAGSRPVALSTEDLAALGSRSSEAKQDAIITALGALLTNAQLRASALPVGQSGVWNITNISGSIALPTGAATAANQDAMKATLGAIDTKLGGTLTVTGGLTDGQLRASALPVSGPLTDAQLRATTVSVQLTAGATALGTGGVSGDSIASSGTVITTRTVLLGYNGASFDRLRGDANGLVVQSALTAATWSFTPAAGGIVNSAAGVIAKAAGAAGIRNFIKSAQIIFGEMGADAEVLIRDGVAGTVLWRGFCPAGAAGSLTPTFDPPLKGTAATAVEVALSVATTGAVYINLQGFTGV